jgi:RND superfamily putative drug exporter
MLGSKNHSNRHHSTKPVEKTRSSAQNFAGRVGQWSANHWKTAVLAWLVFVIGAAVAGGVLGTKQIDQNEANVGESRAADKIIREAGFTVNTSGESVEAQSQMVLIQSATLATSAPAFRAALADAEKTLRAFPQVHSLHSPLTPRYTELTSKDGHSAMVEFIPEGTYEEAVLYIDRIVAAVDKLAARHPGLTFDSVGVSTEKALDAEIKGGLGKAGMISIPLTIIILLIVLGSLVGALIPLMVGLTSVVGAFGLVGLSSQGVAASENIMEVILLVGLAVGVDYSLFYMRREREERAAGRSERAALEAAAATSGHAILVSGITVLIAMAGMFLSGDKTFMSFSVGTMLVVLVAMIGSLTVLPAVLSKLGDRVEKGKIPFVGRLRGASSKRSMWGAIVDRVLRRPVMSAVAATAILVALAVPTLQLHTTQTGMEGITTPVVDPFKRVIKAFPGTPDPAQVAIKAENVNAAPVQTAIAQLEQKALATGEMQAPITVEINRAGTVAKIDIPLAGNGVDSRSTAALASLRQDLLPETLGTVAGVEYAVTGMTANSQDFNTAQTNSIPLVFGFVLLFAFGLLLVSFRSIVIAIKAILLNLLSVAAAYGVLVAIFQWGWGESLLGFESNGGIANWLPMFMFVILFGLSMDYHVFILSRIREGYDKGLSTEQAIAHGIRATAGTVTSAAFVMVGVFLVFVTLPLVDLKEMGIGLAVAVLIDATLVRAVLLPATMKLLGDRNWYLPSWLGWLPNAGSHEATFAPVPVPAGD